MHVLLIEDDALDAKALRKAIAAIDLPIELSLRTTVDEALAFLAEGPPPQLIISDLKLPGEKGWALPELIRSTGGLPAPPVVLLSTSAEPDEIARSYAQGAAGYFRKPVGSLAWQNLMRKILLYWTSAEHVQLP